MTPEFPFLTGNFSIAGSSVPYFQLSLSAADALAHLRVARELIFDPNEIVIDELFQRDIDDNRVRKEIAPYLEREGEIKFFNSLVVVLLPQSKGKLSREYAVAESDNGRRKIDGLKSNPGSIQWDPDRICAIIIDGQHRYSALRELERGGKVDLSATAVPVVALVLHESVGFEAAAGSLLSTVRKIFIDLNRQARTVSKTRNVLLDDRDVAAIGVRSLLEPQVRPTESKLSERLAHGRTPLALVDWYSDKLKFDQGVHLTSILSLYQIVEDFLDIPNIDPYAYEKGKSLVSHFLQLSADLDFSETLSTCIENKRPFFLTTDDIRKFEEWFSGDWGPAFVYVLLNLKPYQSHVETLCEAELLDGRLEIWAALDQAGKQTFQSKHDSDLNIELIAQNVTATKRGKLPFQVIFQRSIMRAFFEMCRAHQTSGESAKDARGYAIKWVDAFNSRFGSLCEETDYWKGCVVRGDGSINPTRTAEKATAGLVLHAHYAPIQDWAKLSGADLCHEVDDFIADAIELEKSRPTCPHETLRKTYFKAWRSSVRKFVQDTQGIYGQGETPAISLFMRESLCKVAKQYTAPVELEKHEDEEDELILLDDK